MHLYQRKSPWRFLLSNFINSPNSASSLTCTLQSRPPDLLSFLPLSPRQPTRLFPCDEGTITTASALTVISVRTERLCCNGVILARITRSVYVFSSV